MNADRTYKGKWAELGWSKEGCNQTNDEKSIPKKGNSMGSGLEGESISSFLSKLSLRLLWDV